MSILPSSLLVQVQLLPYYIVKRDIEESKKTEVKRQKCENEVAKVSQLLADTGVMLRRGGCYEFIVSAKGEFIDEQ
jgi:hypothetical protein